MRDLDGYGTWASDTAIRECPILTAAYLLWYDYSIVIYMGAIIE